MLKRTDDLADLVADRARIDVHMIVHTGQLAEQRLGDLSVSWNDDFTGLAIDHIERNLFAQQYVRECFSELFVQLVFFLFVLFANGLGLALGLGRSQFLFRHLFARRNFHIHHDAVCAGRYRQGGILHIRSLLPENCAKQSLLRRQLGFALRRNLSDQDISRLNLRADANNTVWPEVTERFFAHIRNVTSDFFRPKLRVASTDLEFVNVNGSVNILLHHLLRNQNSVLEVVAIPWHERH